MLRRCHTIDKGCCVPDARLLLAIRVRSFNQYVNVAFHSLIFLRLQILDQKLPGHIIHNMVKTKMNNKMRTKVVID